MRPLLLLLLVSASRVRASNSVEPDGRVSAHESIPSWQRQANRLHQLTCSDTFESIHPDDITHAYGAYYDETNANAGAVIMRQVFLLSKAYSVHYVEARDCGAARVREYTEEDETTEGLLVQSVNWTKAEDADQIAYQTLGSVR